MVPFPGTALQLLAGADAFRSIGLTDDRPLWEVPQQNKPFCPFYRADIT